MKKVQEQAAAKSIRSTFELYELISGYYGRVLRIQSYGYQEEDPGYSDGFGYRGPTPEAHYVEDFIGPVVSLKLNSRRELNGRSSARRDSFLLKLKDTDSLTVIADRSSISVLQEDTNSWKLLHVGEKFSAGAAKLEG